MTGAAAIRQQALARAAAGDDAGAARLFADGIAAFPGDAAFLNSAGNFHNAAGRAEQALALFERAVAVQPDHVEAAINRAVMLTKLDRARESAGYLASLEAALAGAPRYWTTRAAAELSAGDVAGAGRSYDRALLADPVNPRALAGRAQTAITRAEPDAARQYELALARTPGDPHLLLGLADAYAADGQIDDALTITDALATRAPGWIPGLERHAELRLARGDGDDFCDHYRRALDAAPSPALVGSWARMLAGVDRFSESADVAARGLERWPDDPGLPLIVVANCDAAGRHADAADVFDRYPHDDVEWSVHRARHHLYRGEPDAAEPLLAAAIAAAPDHIAAWSLREVAWRSLDDPRSAWLSDQEGLVRSVAVDLPPGGLERAITTLTQLHERSSLPIGQSVRGGKQTRGGLFDRHEPIFADVRAALDAALERYREALPPADPAHPLLRHRDAAWRITGSWSIQLDGRGHHAAHVHPLGIVSSAFHLVVPDAIATPDEPGWLEIGRPPAGLGDLPPIAAIRPRPGCCVLFPSYLFHGTRPIHAGRRLTIAFDVTAA